jgi:thiamine-phosphate pyrophosphorylase
VIGYSAHDLGDVTGPMREHVDYYFYSPIFPTGSKPGHAGVGVDELAGVCERSEVSVYALGGITPERVASCTEAGAAGVAVLSGIMEAADPAEAASAYVRQMKG